MLDLPAQCSAGSSQGDAIKDSVLLLWLPPSNLEHLGNWRARQPKLLGIGMTNEVNVGS